MNVQVLQDQSLISINPDTVKNLAINFLSFHHLKFDEVAIHFVDTPTICDLHQQFFNDSSTTDCISFPMDDDEEEGYKILGDVFVCPQTAFDYVEKNGGDVCQEITLYVIHGLLHLLGFDDIEEEDRLQMREEEARYLKHVSIDNLWIKKSSDTT